MVSGPWSCGRGFGWYALAIVFCLLGMGTKEVMVTAPIAVLLYDRAFLTGSFRACWRERWRVHGALFATWLLPAWLLPGTGGRGGTVGFGSGMAWWEYAGAQCAAIPRYLGLSFWPEPLVFDYGDALPRHGPANLAWLVLMAALLGTALIAWWRWPRAGFPGAWFLLILAPSSSVVPVATQVMAEHRMYLPLAGVLAGTVIGLWAVAGRRTLWLGLAAAVALGALTVRRNADYRSDVRLWTDTVAKRPGNARARASLAYLLARQGRLAEAIAQYEAALRAKPGFAEARVNLGNAQFGAGRVDDAIATFREALRRDPESAQAHYDLGTILARSGRFAGAIDEYGVALRLNPGNADAHNNLGNVLLQLGRASEAVSQYEEALRLVPTSADVHVNCGNALAALRRYAEARGHFEAALRLRPDDAAARAGLERLTAAGPPPDR